MISVDEALAEILRHVAPLETEEVPILDALGRVLADDIESDQVIPPFDNSGVDGYAARSADLVRAASDCPVELTVAGSVAAGYVFEGLVEQRSAIRIMTGAPLPPGADCVVMFEDTSDAERSKEERLASPARVIQVRKSLSIGENVRPAGEDVRRGERVLKRGQMVRPQEVGVLASLGWPTVWVHRRPRVAILATGDELLEIGVPLLPGKIRNSNEYTNAALVARAGGIPIRLGIARDTAEDLKSRIHFGVSQGVDLFLTSGGVSVGDYDVVKDVLSSEGRIQFWQVRMKPGKPLAFGLLAPRGTGRPVPLIGLPGNPVSAMVSFEQFVRPAILKMLGHSSWAKPSVRAVMDESLTNSGRRAYVRVVVSECDGRHHARVTGEQGSGVLTSMARANGLAVIPEDVMRVEAGEELLVQMLDWPEGAGCPW